MIKPPHNKKTHAYYVEQVARIKGVWVRVLEKYVDDGTKILHMCDNGHRHAILPNSVLRGYGCELCARVSRGLKRRKTQDQYLKDVKRYHKDKITVIGTYQGAFVKIAHSCNACNFTWNVTPDNITNSSKTGCPRCIKGVKNSNKATRWLREEARARGIRIRHADNWGEYRIPDTRMQVDGYHKPTNTVFEFYGDCYHGNPQVFRPRTRCHPFNKSITAYMLHKNTMTREQWLRDMGYNVITIWERDYDNQVRQSKIR